MKIVCIDLDGCLCQYPDGWINFVNQTENKNFKNLNEMKESLSFKGYKELKLKYRTSGVKAKLEMIKDADSFTQKLRESGYTIIILTARPIYEIPEVFRDTLSWLKDNKICYDLIFVGKDKHIKIQKYFPKISFIVEDNAGIANQVAALGYKVYVVDNVYNRQPLNSGCSRIFNLKEILESEIFE